MRCQQLIKVKGTIKMIIKQKRDNKVMTALVAVRHRILQQTIYPTTTEVIDFKIAKNAHEGLGQFFCFLFLSLLLNSSSLIPFVKEPRLN